MSLYHVFFASRTSAIGLRHESADLWKPVPAGAIIFVVTALHHVFEEYEYGSRGVKRWDGVSVGGKST